jgi:hypothetical protein
VILGSLSADQFLLPEPSPSSRIQCALRTTSDTSSRDLVRQSLMLIASIFGIDPIMKSEQKSQCWLPADTLNCTDSKLAAAVPLDPASVNARC